MSARAISVADLRAFDLFDDLADDELEGWLPHVRHREVVPGEVIADFEGPSPGLLLLCAGDLRTYTSNQGRPEPLGRQTAPTWIGAIAVLTGQPLRVRIEGETPARLGVIPVEEARRMILAAPAVHQRVMAAVGPVMSRLTAIEGERERLASLGTMAAGLAHELNNPAAAARRAAAQLAETLDTISLAFGRFVEAGVERTEAHELVRLRDEAVRRAAERTALDALDAADAEEALLEQLEDAGVEDAWRLAEPLAAAGLDADWVRRVREQAGPATDAALGWTAATLSARGLVQDLQEATERMTGLVGAVKSYTYMDRGALVEADLHEGLETTLTVLGHKLKHTGIEVVRRYDRELPKITARGPELNQVWTNLLDNAIDALGDSGTITITTRRDGGCVEVDIADDGPGVPEELQARIFESFFTTKDVGAGTGLGLATARRIVVDRHDGTLRVDSRPGATTFRVRLPLTPT